MLNKNFFKNKSILITGGTGSLGNKFVEYLLKNHNPKKIIIYSRDELKQSIMSQKFSSNKYYCMRYFLGDIRDVDRLSMAMQDVDYVLHAAALKHVNIAEYNPFEFIKTNILGAENVVKAAIKNNVKKVIAMSTDKAVDPINLYGATKLTSDKIFVSSNNIVGLKKKTRFSVVRYGNVVASRGSVVPLFYDLASKKEKNFPITDLRMTRFLITLNQSINFIVQSFLEMQGGEIFIPKIPSVKITDIAKAIMPSCSFKIVGIRPGEKIHEKLFSINESHYILEFKTYFIIKPSITFFENSSNYQINKSNEKGKKPSTGFEYCSSSNKNFLNIMDIKKLLKNNIDI